MNIIKDQKYRAKIIEHLLRNYKSTSTHSDDMEQKEQQQTFRAIKDQRAAEIQQISQIDMIKDSQKKKAMIVDYEEHQEKPQIVENYYHNDFEKKKKQNMIKRKSSLNASSIINKITKTKTKRSTNLTKKAICKPQSQTTSRISSTFQQHHHQTRQQYHYHQKIPIFDQNNISSIVKNKQNNQNSLNCTNSSKQLISGKSTERMSSSQGSQLQQTKKYRFVNPQKVEQALMSRRQSQRALQTLQKKQEEQKEFTNKINPSSSQVLQVIQSSPSSSSSSLVQPEKYQRTITQEQEQQVNKNYENQDDVANPNPNYNSNFNELQLQQQHHRSFPNRTQFIQQEDKCLPRQDVIFQIEIQLSAKQTQRVKLTQRSDPKIIAKKFISENYEKLCRQGYTNLDNLEIMLCEKITDQIAKQMYMINQAKQAKIVEPKFKKIVEQQKQKATTTTTTNLTHVVKQSETNKMINCHRKRQSHKSNGQELSHVYIQNYQSMANDQEIMQSQKKKTLTAVHPAQQQLNQKIDYQVSKNKTQEQKPQKINNLQKKNNETKDKSIQFQSQFFHDESSQQIVGAMKILSRSRSKSQSRLKRNAQSQKQLIKNKKQPLLQLNIQSQSSYQNPSSSLETSQAIIQQVISPYARIQQQLQHNWQEQPTSSINSNSLNKTTQQQDHHHQQWKQQTFQHENQKQQQLDLQKSLLQQNAYEMFQKQQNNQNSSSPTFHNNKSGSDGDGDGDGCETSLKSYHHSNDNNNDGNSKELKYQEQKQQKQQHKAHVCCIEPPQAEQNYCSRRIPLINLISQEIITRAGKDTILTSNKLKEQKKRESILKSKILKEQKQLQECSFKPRINNLSKSIQKNKKKMNVSAYLQRQQLQSGCQSHHQKQNNPHTANTNVRHRFDDLYDNYKTLQAKKNYFRQKSIDQIPFKPELNPISKRIMQTKSKKNSQSTSLNNSRVCQSTSSSTTYYHNHNQQNQPKSVHSHCKQQKSINNKSSVSFFEKKRNTFDNFERNLQGLQIGEYLYKEAMRMKKRKDSAPMPTVEHFKPLEESEKLIYQMKCKRLSEYFDELVFLGGSTQNQQQLLPQLIDLENQLFKENPLKLLKPLLIELKELEVILNRQQFIQSGLKLIDYLSQDEKSQLLSKKHHKQQNQRETLSFIKQPKMNQVSQQLISKKQYYLTDIYNRGLIHKKNTIQKIETTLQNKVRQQLQGCTFNPRINIRKNTMFNNNNNNKV